MHTKSELDHEAIAALVRGLDPIDWVQMRLTASLTPAQHGQGGRE